MSGAINENDFVLGLEQNAIDSLVHGVEHFVNGEKPTDLKYTILHVFHAVELFLKARLARTDPSSIFTKKQHTVDFRTAIKRLREAGIEVSEQNYNDLNSLGVIRNSIEHYQIQFDRNAIEHYIGRAMFFLDSFLSRELGINLKEQLDEDTYAVILEALYTYKEQLEKAKEPLRQAMVEMERGVRLEERPYLYSLMFCPQCSEETILIPDPTSRDKTVHCFFCDSRFVVEFCERCDSPILTTLSSIKERDIDEPLICENCWDELDYRIKND